MANHYVICKYCNQRFNRAKEESVLVGGRRYAHPKCVEEYEKQKTQEEKDIAALETYIKNLFKINTLTAKIKRQINSFKKEYNYTYSGILKTLTWWFEIKGNSIEKANDGIGIVPYVYQNAHNYYYSLYLAEFTNSLLSPEASQIKVKEVCIEEPTVEKKQPKLFNLEV